MSYKGLFLRQYMGQSSNMVPHSTDSWGFSPDLLVYGVKAAYNTQVFNASTDDYEGRAWYFSQAPTAGVPNYIYIRAYATVGNLTAKVYLFYCDENTLLQPKNWKSDNFSVTVRADQPLNQNYFYMSAVSPGPVMSFDPFTQHGSLVTWFPPKGTTPPHYYLIAWVDNSQDESNPPPFPTMNDFAKLGNLANYVKNNANMVFLDTWYQGLFLRQYAGQTHDQAGAGSGTSPDIIVTSITAAPDASGFSTSKSYNSSTLQQTATSRMRNFVYIRGLNTNPNRKTARVYLYYADGGFSQSPASWKYDTFSVAGKSCNYIELTADANGVVTSQIPIVWQVDTSANYILIAYVENDPQDEPSQPDFSIFGFTDPDTIEQFVVTQPRLTWLKVNAVAPQQVPDLSYNFPLTIKAGNYYYGLKFSNLPTIGTLTFSIPGDSSSNTLVMTNMSICDPNAAVTWELTFKNNLSTSLVFNFWSNGGSTPGGADVQPIILENVASLSPLIPDHLS